MLIKTFNNLKGGKDFSLPPLKFYIFFPFFQRPVK